VAKKRTGPSPRASKRASSGASKKKWVSKVKTVSTYPPEGLFTKDAAMIARQLASKKVSPRGPGSGMRMLTYFINRAGKGLSKSRRAELEKAKKLLSKRVQAEREKTRSKTASAK
jgi:hypothetical protein